jgi:hypothetical protein
MTLALREWQAAVAAQLSNGGGASRLAIHRHHIASSLARALATTFSTVQALVGEEFFRQAAQAFARDVPPTQPVLAEYGADFPAFVAGYAPAQGLPYLADVARLDWALNTAFYSPRGRRLSATELAAVPPEELTAAGVPLAAGTTLLRSVYPLDLIWAASQPGAPDTPVDLAHGPVRLLVLRHAEEAGFIILSEGEAAFVAALQEGQSLEKATGAAFAAETGFDLARCFSRLLACEAFAALQQ